MSLDDLSAKGISVRPSAVESERFGLSVTRVAIGGEAPEGRALVAALDAVEGQVLIVRYDATRLDRAGLLAGGRRVVIPAGSLIYWEGALPFSASTELPDGIETIWLDALPASRMGAITDTIAEIARASFDGYPSHYAANPLLDEDAAVSGYVDWAMRSISRDPANVQLLTQHGDPVGMMTVEYGAQERHIELLLAGLLPSAQRHGWYRFLLEGAARAAAARGVPRLVVPTQVYNTNVQRVWARVGMRPFAAIETLHLVEPELLTGGPTFSPA